MMRVTFQEIGIMPFQKKLLDASAARFLLVGVVNTLFGLLVIYALKWFLGMGDAVANLLGYLCGLSLSFLLNSRWTFRYSGPRLPALVKFLLVIGLAYGLNLATVLGAIHVLHVDTYLAHLLGIPPYTIFSYVCSRFLVFKSPHNQECVPCLSSVVKSSARP